MENLNLKRKHNEIENGNNDKFVQLLQNYKEEEFIEYLIQEAKETIAVNYEYSKNGYVWNEKEKLWKRCYFETMVLRLRECWNSCIIRNLQNINEDQNSYLKSGIENAEKFQRKIQSFVLIKQLYNQVYLKLVNPDFMRKLNRKIKYLPIQNQQVINLQTKKVRPRTKEDVFSFECPVSFIEKKNDSTYEVAESYLKSICNGNMEYAKYLQKVVGYCLTGEVVDTSHFILHGKGQNGKSVFCDILKKILGDQYTLISLNDILKEHCRSNTDVELLRPMVQCRLSFNRHVHEITLRKKNNMIVSFNRNCFLPLKNYYTFSPLCKKFTIVDNKPEIIENDGVDKNVIKFLPFEATFETNEFNDKYVNELKTKYLDILFSYFVDGASEWYKTKKLQDSNSCSNLVMFISS